MKQLLTVILFFSCVAGFGQTKLISHKSHSGNVDDFAFAVENNLFDIGDSNFGEPPHRMVKKYTIDSVISLPDKKTVIISSEKKIIEYLRYSGEKNEIKDTISFIPGRDTVYNHPLFSKIHSLDSVKTVLGMKNGFPGRSQEEVQFIGYDNKAEKYADENKKEVKKKNNKKGAAPFTNDETNFPSKPLIILVLMMFSVIVMLLYYLLIPKKALLSA